MQGREGAQYRRVRKMAEQNMRKDAGLELGGQMVEGLPCNQLMMKQGNANASVAPRFYPTSHKQRRSNADIFGRSQVKKISINGDEINVRGLGKQVFI